MKTITCTSCGETITENANLNNLCLNCYQNQCDDLRKCDIESDYDYYNGYGII